MRALSVVVLLLAAGCERPAPDVLLVVVDTLRADAVGVYGEAQPVTPNIDALADVGVRFDRAIATAGYTAPSHASLFTGRYPRRHSIGYSNGRSRLGQEPTWAEQMSAAGYDTAAFVSNMVLHERIGLKRGFTHYDDRLPSREAVRKWARERTAAATTRAATAWLRKPRREPFFLWVHYQDPHGPYTPPAAFREQFRGSRAGASSPLPAAADHFGEGGVPGYQRLEDAETLNDYHGRYLAELAYVDQQVGVLLAAAENVSKRPLLVVFTSDHGESFGEESFYLAHGHTGMPDLARVPLIVAGLGIDRQLWRQPISLVDVMPTVLGLLGLPPVADIDGRDLSGALRAAREPPPVVAYCDVGYELVAYHGERVLRVSGERNVTVDVFYKSGRADRSGALLQLGAGVSSRTYAWRPDRTLAPAPELWGVDAYLARQARAGAEVKWSDDELEALRELGYVDSP